ncbi:MAG: thiaminase II, partial [Salinarchaeum sp.]
GDHRYTPFIEAYTGEEFREVVAWVTELVDTYGERYPGYQNAMKSAFLQSARLEYTFWESCYTRETWDV